MADTSNLYQELKDALTEFEAFLKDSAPKIKPAINTLAALFPKIKELIQKLIDLMIKLEAAIDKLDVTKIPDLDKVSDFTSKITSLLTTAKGLLPAEAAAIDDVLAAANVVSSLSLPSLDTIRGDIKTLLESIINLLKSLKSA